MSESSNPNDPFRDARRQAGVLRCPFQGEEVPMILRHGDVRTAARDWKKFSSDAPFRVPIPSEEDMRSMRQLPIETDPPAHTEYRALVEPFFQRSRTPEVAAKVEALIRGLLERAMEAARTEIVHDFALPIQSRALTYLLDVPESEAETYIGWGIHVFNDRSEAGTKSPPLEDYLQARFDQAEADPGEDFFSALTRARYQGRPLSRDEMMGFANLTFAGGRDTIIHSISSIMAYFADHPAALDFLRGDPKRIVLASEEFFRVFMPLTHIGRVCPEPTDVLGETVPAGGRVSLGWVSANHDEAVFERPDEIRLDRKPNPHLSFGFGTHLCLGAPHARLIIRTLLKELAGRVAGIAVIEAVRHLEQQGGYARETGYDSLTVSVQPV